jgi:hypothetical protein
MEDFTFGQMGLSTGLGKTSISNVEFGPDCELDARDYVFRGSHSSSSIRQLLFQDSVNDSYGLAIL